MREASNIESIIKQLEVESSHLKSPQFISRRSIINYRTHSDSNFDFNFRIFQSNPTRYFRITFNHATAKEGALLSLRVFTRWDNSNVMQNPIPYQTPAAPPLHVRWRKHMPPQGDKTIWTVRVAKGQVGINYYDAYFKFFFEGTDTGTWTVEML